jgi:hypothetical protein
MLTKSNAKSALLATLMTGAFLVSASSFAQTAPAAKPSTATTKVVSINETCKKAHPDTMSQAYKDCVKKAEQEKKKESGY